MEPLSIATLITGIVSAITGIVGGIANAVNTQKTNEQQIDLQNQAWEKQSIPSRMEELEKAGLNKQLATGMNPNYQVSARLQTPDMSFMGENAGKVLDTLMSTVGAESTAQQTKNAKKQAEILGTNAEVAKETLAQERLKTSLLKHDIDIKIKRPYASDEPSLLGVNPRAISGLLSMLGIGTGDGQIQLPTPVQIVKDTVNTVKDAPKKVEEKVDNFGKWLYDTVFVKPNQKKRKETVENAWRTNPGSIGSINYSHGYGRSNGY